MTIKNQNESTMKKYIIRIVILVVIAMSITTSCQDNLEIIPTQNLTPDKALTSESDLIGVLIGAYDGLQRTALYGGNIQLVSDIWANRYYLRFRGTFNYLLQIANITTTSNLILTNNELAQSTWTNAYRTINICNIVLENLNLSTGSIRPTAEVEGEALYIRGSLYFELARLYGKTWGDGNNDTNLAVPLILKSTPFEVNELNETNYPSRNTIAEIYNQAKADLTKASELLPATNQHYATKWAALAQLSRMALMQGDYSSALDATNQVIASGQYSLTESFDNLWFNFINFGGIAPREYIFYIKVTTQDGANGLNNFYGQTLSSIPGSSGRGDLDVQTPWVNLHEIDDQRRTYFEPGSGGRRLTRKHLDRYGHVPVIRLAEMYLTRAEANFRLGTEVGDSPVNDINRIRQRVGLPDYITLTLDNILIERKLELAFEGHLIHDIKRLRSNTAGTNNTNGPAWNSHRIILPIPQRELDANKNLVQNEGY